MPTKNKSKKVTIALVLTGVLIALGIAAFLVWWFIYRKKDTSIKIGVEIDTLDLVNRELAEKLGNNPRERELVIDQQIEDDVIDDIDDIIEDKIVDDILEDEKNRLAYV